MFLSIIIPAYNEENYLARCLDSIQAQSDPRFELIVVDNDSTDRTAEIARQHTELLLHEPAKGYHNAVRTGVQIATGDLIAICDADTIYDPGWVKSVYAAFKQDMTGIYGAVDFHDGPPVRARLVMLACYRLFPFLMRLLGIDVLAGFNFVIRRAAYDQVGGYDPRIYDCVGLDVELARRLSRAGKVRYVPSLKARTSYRTIAGHGVYRYLRMNLPVYWSMLTGRNIAKPYDEYNMK